MWNTKRTRIPLFDFFSYISGNFNTPSQYRMTSDTHAHTETLTLTDIHASVTTDLTLYILNSSALQGSMVEVQSYSSIRYLKWPLSQSSSSSFKSLSCVSSIRFRIRIKTCRGVGFCSPITTHGLHFPVCVISPVSILLNEHFLLQPCVEAGGVAALPVTRGKARNVWWKGERRGAPRLKIHEGGGGGARGGQWSWGCSFRKSWLLVLIFQSGVSSKYSHRTDPAITTFDTTVLTPERSHRQTGE